MGTRIWDISQPLRTGIRVWHGDTEYVEARTRRLTDDCPPKLATLDASPVRAILRELS